MTRRNRTGYAVTARDSSLFLKVNGSIQSEITIPHSKHKFVVDRSKPDLWSRLVDSVPGVVDNFSDAPFLRSCDLYFSSWEQGFGAYFHFQNTDAKDGVVIPLDAVVDQVEGTGIRLVTDVLVDGGRLVRSYDVDSVGLFVPCGGCVDSKVNVSERYRRL